VRDLADEWFRLYVDPVLAVQTGKNYRRVWVKWLAPQLGDVSLQSVTPRAVYELRAAMHEQGAGVATVRMALAVLQSMFERAVEWGRVPLNPVRLVRKPRYRRPPAVRALSPITVEQIRAHLLERGNLRSATLVSVLAYAGLRPGEALALRWQDIRRRTILVERAVSAGELKGTKNGVNRAVVIWPPLRTDLEAWRNASAPNHPSTLVFPDYQGNPWPWATWGNWRKRSFAPAARSAGAPGIRPYDLRHAFCSLLLARGATIIEVSDQAGHSPRMSLETYGHLLDETSLDGFESPTESIFAARRQISESPSAVMPSKPIATHHLSADWGQRGAGWRAATMA